MKPRSMFINASRGMVVDDVALRENILSGHIAGAALDVFPVEPKAQGDPFESALRGLPNVILTPHVGGSTQEAQEEIGFFVSGKLSSFLDGGSTALSVNLPEVAAPPLGRRFPDRAAAPQRAGRARLGQPGARRPRANVRAQYLSTRGEQGYVVTDTSTELPAGALDGLRDADHTIWLRTY